MKKYYFAKNNEQYGPYNIDELAEKEIFSDTLIWTEEFEDWKKASSVTELELIIKKNKPFAKKEKIRTLLMFVKGNKTIFGVLGAVFILIIGLNFYKNNYVEPNYDFIAKQVAEQIVSRDFLGGVNIKYTIQFSEYEKGITKIGMKVGFDGNWSAANYYEFIGTARVNNQGEGGFLVDSRNFLSTTYINPDDVLKINVKIK